MHAPPGELPRPAHPRAGAAGQIIVALCVVAVLVLALVLALHRAPAAGTRQAARSNTPVDTLTPDATYIKMGAGGGKTWQPPAFTDRKAERDAMVAHIR